MRIKLKLFNCTNFISRDLRRFFIKGMKEKGVTQCEVTLKYSYSIHGMAWLNVGRVYMYCPKTELKLDKNILWQDVPYEFNISRLRQFAQIFLHELDHTLGLNHRDMTDLDKQPTGWIKDLQIRLKKRKGS